MTATRCTHCPNTATTKCVYCSHPLCDNHIKKSVGTTEPACPKSCSTCEQ